MSQAAVDIDRAIGELRDALGTPREVRARKRLRRVVDRVSGRSWWSRALAWLRGDA